MRKIYLLTFAVIISFIAIILPIGNIRTEANSSFTDVNKEEITQLEIDGIVTGFPGQTYRPNQLVTRGEAAAMIGRALKLNGEKRQTIFPDVPANHFASGFIQSAVDAQILGGYPNGTFGLNNSMTREEMAHILTRAFQLTETSVIVFSDVFPSMVSFEPINKLATSQITTGYPGGTFKPRNPITRLEFGILLARALYPEFQGQVNAAYLQPNYEVTIDAPNGINVYPDPSTNKKEIGKLAQGAETSIYVTFGSWAYVGSEEIIGFVPVKNVNAIATTNELEGKTIVVDPGHGGTDPGASGNGIIEKNLILDVGLLAKIKLQSAGATVVMTRDTDVFIPLEGRVEKAHEVNANAFVSIHANANPNSSPHGTETYWNSTYTSIESKELAEKIQKHLIKNLKTKDRGVKQAGFKVIKTSTMPSVLVELGFISNPTEAAKMKTDQFKEASANAIYQGLIEFYTPK